MQCIPHILDHNISSIKARMWKCNTINVYMTWLQKEDIFLVLEKLIRELHQLLTWDLHERLLCVTHKNYCREQCCRGSYKHEQDVRVCCEPEKLKVTPLSRALLSYCALSIKKNPGWYPGWLQLCYRDVQSRIHTPSLFNMCLQKLLHIGKPWASWVESAWFTPWNSYFFLLIWNVLQCNPHSIIHKAS